MSKKGSSSMSNTENTASSARHNGARGTAPAQNRSKSRCKPSSRSLLASTSTQSSAARQNAYTAYTPLRLRGGRSENAR